MSHNSIPPPLEDQAAQLLRYLETDPDQTLVPPSEIQQLRRTLQRPRLVEPAEIRLRLEQSARGDLLQDDEFRPIGQAYLVLWEQVLDLRKKVRRRKDHSVAAKYLRGEVDRLEALVAEQETE